MKILITGANGYVGNYLLNHLSQAHTVVGLMGKEEINLLDSDAVNKLFENKFDIVIHCAVAGRYNHLAADENILASNLRMFLNLYANRHSYDKFINIGSGAEFDLSRSIDVAEEDEIYHRVPSASYALSKNIISKLILLEDKFYTLRVFGLLAESPPVNTLLYKFYKAVTNNQSFPINGDRYFDFFSASDLVKIIEYLVDHNLFEKDINLVYNEKLKISEILTKYCELHKMDSSLINIESTSELNYTGSSKLVDAIPVKLDGLTSALNQLTF